jgi:ribose transport system ATP-binding protein
MHCRMETERNPFSSKEGFPTNSIFPIGNNASHEAGEKRLLLKVRGLTKSFEGNVVLDGVDFDLHPGEVHVLFGENGAGKTTFTKILCGGFLPDAGNIVIDDETVSITNPAHSRELGIVAVHQDFSLVPQMSVIENLYLGRDYKKAIFLDKKAMLKEGRAYFENLNIGLDIDLYQKIRDLPMEKQQAVAIARALLQPLKVLVLDEPTSNFTERETEVLFDHIRELKTKGIGIIYISHIVEELKAIGDRVTILRDGKVVGHIDKNEEITKENLLKGMVKHRERKEVTYVLNPDLGATALEVNHLSTESGLKDVSLSARKGEIVGIGGLPDSGKSLLGRALFGLESILSGEIKIHGKDIAREISPSKALQHHVIYSPAEKLDGLVLCRDVKENNTLPSLKDKFSSHRILQKSRERDAVGSIIDKLNIRPNDMNRRVRFLSGGNQQKVIIGRGLLKEAKTFIFDEITRGVDIASKIDFYRIVSDMAKTAEGVIFITSELSELLDLCHRVIIMYDKRIVATLSHEEATREKLVHSILGLELKL